MARNVITTTISLPKNVAREMKQMSAKKGMTTSELIRDALRHYKRMQRGGMTLHAWSALQKKLRAVSKAGRTRDLSRFIAHDRTSH